MSFMEQQVTVKQDGWIVETRDAGTCYVPADVVPVPEWLRKGVTIQCTDDVFAPLHALLMSYVEGTHIESIEALAKPHYFARMSAPGYMDCTEWCAFATIREARSHLRDMYGEDC